MDRDRTPPATEALREHAWRFLRTTPEHAALLLEPDGTIAWSNDAAHAIFGAATLDGRHVSTCFVEEDVAHGVPRFEADVASKTGAMEDDRWMRRADGSRFWAEGASIALRDDDDERLLGFLKILRNRTTQKMAVETLRNQVEERATYAEHCENAMYTLAHELRNPLATMMACADLVDRLPPGDKRIVATQDMLRRSLGFAVRLVDDLVDVTRAATGRLSLHVEALSLEAVLRNAIGTACERATTPWRTVELLLPPEPIDIEADPLRIEQLFVNLICNALRYTPEDGRIWVSAVLLEDTVLVKIEDTGIGMEAGVLASVFDMFSQAREASMQGGLGIGLALVKQIVEMHGGSVQAQSDGAGQGSKFLVTLPLKPPSPEAAPVGGG
jgi:PAS domain S-box-containing protein